MFSLPKFTTAKQLQKEYRKIFDEVKETGEPIFVMKNNQIDVAIIDAKQLKKMLATYSALKGKEEARAGKAKILKGSLVDLWHEAQNS